MGKYYVGIDIGGTNLKAGLVDESGALLATAKTPLCWSSAESFVETLANLCIAAAKKTGIKKEEICAVGMGVPGEVDRQQGRILYTCNIPLRDVPIAGLFHNYLDAPIYLDNDANCAALGEYYAGAGRGYQNIIVVTLGTGVGAGIILGGRLLRGANGAAGEVGHMVIVPEGHPCPCGRRGCWEQYSSAPALKRLTLEAMEQAPDSALWTHCQGDPKKIGGRSAFQVARECADPAAVSVCRQYVSYLALGITNLVNIFQPELVCIGGGVSNEEDAALLFPLQKIVEKERYDRSRTPAPQILKAKLGNDAGIVGAALLGMK